MNQRTKKCPYCAEIIMEEAIVCRFCNRDLVDTHDKTISAGPRVRRALLVAVVMIILAAGAYFGLTALSPQSTPEATVRAYLDAASNQQDEYHFFTEDALVSVESMAVQLIVLGDDDPLGLDLRVRESRSFPGVVEVEFVDTYFVLERHWGKWYIACIVSYDTAPCYR